MTDGAAVLVIEDEWQTRTLLQFTLGQQGYLCLHAATGMAGVAAALEQAPNVVLLDLGLPDLDGLEVTRRIRERSAVPIIILSARGRETDKISALDSGANDFLTKPFGAGELLARIRAVLRNAPAYADASGTGTITLGDLSINFDLRRVTVADREVCLTPLEYRLLALMMRSEGQVLTHQHILRSVWGSLHAGKLNYLRVYMKKLRHKIEREPAKPKYIVNELGVGYRMRRPA